MSAGLEREREKERKRERRLTSCERCQQQSQQDGERTRLHLGRQQDPSAHAQTPTRAAESKGLAGDPGKLNSPRGNSPLPLPRTAEEDDHRRYTRARDVRCARGAGGACGRMPRSARFHRRRRRRRRCRPRRLGPASYRRRGPSQPGRSAPAPAARIFARQATRRPYSTVKHG